MAFQSPLSFLGSSLVVESSNTGDNMSNTSSIPLDRCACMVVACDSYSVSLVRTLSGA